MIRRKIEKRYNYQVFSKIGLVMWSIERRLIAKMLAVVCDFRYADTDK